MLSTTRPLPAISARRQQWRAPRRTRTAPVRSSAGRCDRNVSYEVEHGFGCSLVAEAAESAAPYGGDLAARARGLDHGLLQLVRNDSAARHVLGRLAGRFLEIHGWERLGFARFGDYTGERLGWSSRQLQEVARVADALARLPLIENAFRRGILNWSKARLLAGIASASDQTKWLAVAAATDVRALTAVTSSARAAAREQRPMAAAPAQQDPATHVDLEDDDQEERVLVHVPCSKRVRRMWNDARRYAVRMVGRTLTQWEVAEFVAAEASSSPGPFHDLWQREPWRSLACAPTSTGHERRHSVEDRPAGGSTVGDLPRPGAADLGAVDTGSFDQDPQSPNDSEEVPSAFEFELERLAERDAFELDAAMRRVRRAMQQRQSQIGDSLGLFLELRLHRQLGYSRAVDYVRERLGMPDRTARELVRVAEAAKNRSPVLASAYASGELSWLKVLTLLSIVKPWNAAAWVRRAGEVTLRRLSDEVAWACERADLEPRFSATMPPPPGQDLGLGDDKRQMCACCGLLREFPPHPAGDERQMCAHCRLADHATDTPGDELWDFAGRIHVAFVAPLSISVLFRTTMQGFASPIEPRWKALERMLEQVLDQWRRQPRHRDPVFARDGYRCTAPGCSSLTNLHDHHIVARSAGGTNELANRTTLCAWHHLRAVHGGLARATGQAPDAIDWEFGLAAGKEPLMRFRGERYRGEQTVRDDDTTARSAPDMAAEG